MGNRSKEATGAKRSTEATRGAADKGQSHIVTCFSDKYSFQSWNRFAFKKEMVLLKKSCADCFRHLRFGGCSPFSGGSQQQDFALFAAGARYIVTHNTRDFAGSDQLGIQAMTPGDFYRLVFHKT